MMGDIFRAIFPVISLQNCASVLNFVLRQIDAQSLDRVWIPLASKHVICSGMNQIGKRKVADSGKKVDNGLASTIKVSNPLLLRDVADAEHTFRDVPSVVNAIFFACCPRIIAKQQLNLWRTKVVI